MRQTETLYQEALKKTPRHDSRHQTSLPSLPETSPPGLPVCTKMPQVKNCLTVDRRRARPGKPNRLYHAKHSETRENQ